MGLPTWLNDYFKKFISAEVEWLVSILLFLPTALQSTMHCFGWYLLKGKKIMYLWWDNYSDPSEVKISVSADFLLQSFVIPIFLISPEFTKLIPNTESSTRIHGSCLSSDVLKRRIFSFHMPWRNQISITKCLYSSREDLPKKLFIITVQEGKKTFSVDSRSSKTSLLKFPGNDQNWLGTLFSDVIGLFQEQKSELINSREWQISPTFV